MDEMKNAKFRLNGRKNNPKNKFCLNVKQSLKESDEDTIA